MNDFEKPNVDEFGNREQLARKYNNIYESSDEVFGRGKPDIYVEAVSEYIDEGHVVELGVGQGRNALYLAENGFSVDAYDVSDVAVDQLNEKADERGLPITGHVEDIREVEFAESEVFVATFVLHHMSESEAPQLIASMQKKTSPGGVHMIATFLNEGGLFEMKSERKEWYPSEDELLNMYADWEIQKVETFEATTRVQNSDGSNVTNLAIRLLATKPSVEDKK